jgi:hypothetical protein
MSKSSAGTQR